MLKPFTAEGFQAASEKCAEMHLAWEYSGNHVTGSVAFTLHEAHALFEALEDGVDRHNHFPTKSLYEELHQAFRGAYPE